MRAVSARRKNPWLAEMERLRDPARFWRKLKTFRVKKPWPQYFHLLFQRFIWLTGFSGGRTLTNSLQSIKS
jgi:hypothetical protein